MNQAMNARNKMDALCLVCGDKASGRHYGLLPILFLTYLISYCYHKNCRKLFIFKVWPAVMDAEVSLKEAFAG